MQEIAGRTIDQCYRPFVGDEGVDWYINSGELDRELEKHIGNCEVLTKDGDIVAFTIYFQDLIHLLIVDVSQHDTGIGSQLLSHAEKRLFDKGNATIRVEAFGGNERAINFYIKRGWTVARRVDDKEHGFNRVFFEKRGGRAPEQRATHLGRLLRWCLEKGGAAEQLYLRKEQETAHRAVDASLSGTEFLGLHDDEEVADAEECASVGHDGGEHGLDGDSLHDSPHETTDETGDIEELAAILASRYQNGMPTESQTKRARPWWRRW